MKLLLQRAFSLITLLTAIVIAAQSTGFGVPVSDGLFQGLTIHADGFSWFVAYLALFGLNSFLTPWAGGLVVLCLIIKEFLKLTLSVKIVINLFALLVFSLYFAAILHTLNVVGPV